MTLDELLGTQTKAKPSKSTKLWIGFSIDGDKAKQLQAEFTKYGIYDRASYIRSLVLQDLKRREAKGKKGATTEETPDKA
jgi:hypothetical protein